MANENFPTADAARRCLSGDCGDSLKWTASRALMLGLGMYLLGEDKQIVRRAIAGSLSVQSFVFLWTLLTRNQDRATLPSVDAVESQDILGIGATYIVRSVLVGLGMYAAGIRDNLVRDALAGTAFVEMGILAWNGQRGT